MGASTGYTSDGYVESYADKGFKGKNGRAITLVDVNPIETATAGNIGDMLIGSFGTYVKITTNGTDTNWQRSADKSQYKLYEDFENYTSAVLPVGWVKYGNTNTALNYPDDFGGSASASSYTTVANTNLTGAKVFRTSLATADNGKGVYKPFSISNGEKGLPFIFETQINITKLGSAEWASNAQIWVVGSNDNFVSNFQNIPLTNYVISKSGLLKGSFIDSSATLTNFRLCIHFSGLTDTFNVDFDEVKIYSSLNDTMFSSGIIGEIVEVANINNPSPQSLLLCDGSAISRTQYSSLFQAIGTTYGVGDGSTTFNVPDFRGIFAKGAGTQTISGVVHTGTFGTKENDQMQGHDHQRQNNNAVTGSFFASNSSNGSLSGGTANMISDGTNGTPRTGTVTRPANISIYYYIRYAKETGSNVIASGENFMPIKAVSSAGQTLPTSTFTEVDFASNNSDPRFTTNSRFKLPVNGRFLVNYRSHANINPTAWACEIRKNGASLASGNLYQEKSGAGANYNNWSWELDTTGNADSDYYSIWIYQNIGSSTTLTSGYNYLNIDRLDKPFSMNLFQASGMVLSPTDNVLPAKFKHSTTQSIPSNTTTVALLTQTVFNPTGLLYLDTVNNRIYNYGNDGYFSIHPNGNITSGSAGRHQLFVYKNGVQFERIMDTGLNAGQDYVTVNTSTELFLEKNSYIDLRFYCSGATQTLSFESVNIKRIDKTAVSAGGGYTKWQRKFLNSLFSTTGTISALSFSNLEIGKHYRVSIQLVESATGGGTYVQILNGATILGRMNHGATTNITTVNSVVFIANSTSLTFNAASNGNGFQGDGTTDATYATLEELPQHIQTNQWT